MTKAELVEAIASRSGVSKADVEKVLKAFEDEVGRLVAKGADKLTIPGFIAFEVVKTSARTGRNPQTGEPVKIKASKRVKISSGSRLTAYAKGLQKPPK
jgi:DNA-binding protein HU-beta